MKEAYAQSLESEEDEDSGGEKIKSRDVGHNIYILAHQVIKIPEPGCVTGELALSVS